MWNKVMPVLFTAGIASFSSLLYQNDGNMSKLWVTFSFVCIAACSRGLVEIIVDEALEKRC